MNWHKFKQEFINELSSIYDIPECVSIFHFIYEDFTGVYRPNHSQLEQPLTVQETTRLQTILQRLLTQEPIQHILGYTYFDDLKLTISPDVLIPRQETEELIYWIKDHNSKEDITIIDLGTGSGAIALALANHYPKASITAVDISQQALTIAAQNAVQHNLNVQFQQGDILHLEETFSKQKFDIIVSNPPYISPSFQTQMPKNVTEFEPHLALFAPENDVLLFYRKIIEFAVHHLNNDGFLFFEINEFYKDELLDLLQQNGLTGEAKQDLNSNWRMIRATINTSK